MAFGGWAQTYDRFRPGYPQAAVAWMIDAAGPVRVLDLGAGTGRLAAAAAAAGHDVLAVEPDEQMRSLAQVAVPGRTAAGTAESIPVADRSVDVVLVGQAFHWFDPVRAAAQLRRIVRPGGVVGVLANLRDDRVAWFRELGRVVGGADWSQANQDEVAESMVEHFPNVQRREFANPISMTPDELEQLVGTFSYVRLRDDVAEVVARVRRGLDEHPDTAGRSVIDVPYVTVVFRSVVPD